jgi:hypothetical protein
MVCPEYNVEELHVESAQAEKDQKQTKVHIAIVRTFCVHFDRLAPKTVPSQKITADPIVQII